MTGRDEMFPSRAHFRLSREVGGQTPCLAISLHSFPKRASTCPNNSPFPFSLLSLLRSFLPSNTALRAFFRTLFSPPRLICFSTIPLSQSAGLLSNFISLIY